MLKILLVEDDRLVLETLKEDLQDEGFQVTVATNGIEAVSELQKASFDMLVTDIIMPGKEGIATILECKKLQPAMKIIAMSGGGRAGVSGFLDIAKKSGADEVIRKPFRSSQLIRTIRTVSGETI